MTLTQIANLLVALILWAPISVVITQTIKRSGWGKATQTVCAFLVAVLVAVAGTWVSGDLLGLMDSWGELTSAQVIAYAGVVFASASVWYQAYFGRLDWMAKLAEWPKGS